MIRSRTTALLSAVWLFLATVVLLPGHAAILFPSTSSINTSVAQTPAPLSHGGHHPDDCQICKLDGQLLSIICIPVTPTVDYSVGLVPTFATATPAAAPLRHSSGRAPPISTANSSVVV
jgi:hypothetical protein